MKIITSKTKLSLFFFIIPINLAFAQESSWIISPTISYDRFKAREFNDRFIWLPFPPKTRNGFSVGINVKRKLISDRFSIVSGIIYTKRRWEHYETLRVFIPFDEIYEYTDRYMMGNLHLFRIPVLIEFSHSNFSLSVGPSFDFAWPNKGRYQLFPHPGSSILALDLRPNTQRLILSAEARLGYSYRINDKFSIGPYAFYHYMFSQTYKDKGFGDTNTFLRSYGLGFMFNRYL